MRDALAWLADELDAVPFGEVGLTFTIAKGKITRIEQIERKSYKGEARTP